MIAELAEALQQALEQGAVHTDIQTSNVLLGADGRPRFIDFGEVSMGSTDVRAGSRIGNPSYMPPEIMEGKGSLRDPRGDVYALGVVLYEALTNQRPFTAGRVMELLPRVLGGKFTAPRRIVRSIPAALEAICLKAMARNPDDRYGTAGDLAAALRDFLTPRRKLGFWK